MSAGNINCREASIRRIKLDSSDQHISSTGFVTPETVAQDALILPAFTPETTSDYLIIARALVANSDTLLASKTQLSIDGTLYNALPIKAVSTGDQRLWCCMIKVALDATPHTIKIQTFVSSLSGTVQLYSLRIVAIRWDKFQNAYYGESRAQSTTTLTAYTVPTTDKVTLTQTPMAPACQHVVMAAGAVYNTGLGVRGNWARCLQDATTLQENRNKPTTNSTTDTFPFFAMYRTNVSGSPVTWKIQWRSDVGAASSGISSCAVAVIQVGGCGVELRQGKIQQGQIR